MPVAPPPAPTPSPLIYPAESIPIRFDHARHAKVGATCEGCHLAATASTSAADNLIPPEAACRVCHKIDRAQPTKAVPAGQAPARCDACHVASSTGAEAGDGRWMPTRPVDQPPRVLLAHPNLKFNHRLHAARGMACSLCHAGAENVAVVTRADLPLMATCLGCHDGKQATARCTACHLAEADGRVKVRLATAATAAVGGTGLLMPSGSLKGLDAHGPTFRRDHNQIGREETYCLTCHRRNDCIDCHGGVVPPPDIHPADYESLHVVDARRNTPDCSSCHRLQTFCVGCHQRTGVAEEPTGGQPGRRANNPFGTGTGIKTFHPPGWARDAAGAVISTPRPNSHALAGQTQHPVMCVLSPRGELPRLPLDRPQPWPGVLAPRAGVRRYGALPILGCPQPSRLRQMPRAGRAGARLRVNPRAAPDGEALAQTRAASRYIFASEPPNVIMKACSLSSPYSRCPSTSSRRLRRTSRGTPTLRRFSTR